MQTIMELSIQQKIYKGSKNTVKKWCRRYALTGLCGLKDRSRKPKHSPKRIDKNDIQKIKEVTKEAHNKKKYITVKNIRKKTNISKYSDTTINRYINRSLGKIKNIKHNNNIFNAY